MDRQRPVPTLDAKTSPKRAPKPGGVDLARTASDAEAELVTPIRLRLCRTLCPAFRERPFYENRRRTNARRGPRLAFVPAVAEVLTEHRAFSTHTLAKVSWSVAKSEGGGTTRQSSLFRIEDLKPA
jgi:hypothetical protein